MRPNNSIGVALPERLDLGTLLTLGYPKRTMGAWENGSVGEVFAANMRTSVWIPSTPRSLASCAAPLTPVLRGDQAMLGFIGWAVLGTL